MGDLSVADAMALSGRRDDDYGMMGAWNNPFIYLVWMWVMRAFNGENGGNALTQAELFDGLGRQDILGNQREMQQTLCGLGKDVATGFGNTRYDNLNNTFALQSNINAGFSGVERSLCDNRFAQQECCCAQQRAIDGVRAEGYKNTCEITSAIHAEGEATRALINEKTMQELRDKLADRDRDLLYANFQNSQYVQNSYLIETLRPIAKPAYISCSPYQTSTPTCVGCQAY